MPWKAPLAKPIGQPKRRRTSLNSSQRGYDWTHQRTRRARKAAEPLCEFAFGGLGKGNPCTGWSEEMDHRDGNTRNTAPENLVMTCRPCHEHKTAENQRKYGHG